MTVDRISPPVHTCDLPQTVRYREYSDGEIVRCDECGRFWRFTVWFANTHRWKRVGRLRSRLLRRRMERGDQP